MAKYQLKLWNKKYGDKAEFIVKNTKTEKYALFQPSRAKDTAWVANDLTQDPSYKNWDDFQDEPVEDLNDVIM